MKIKLVHKAGDSDTEHSASSINNINMNKGKTRATGAPQIDQSYHDPDDPSYDPRLDPDVGPYDTDNDYLPDDTMTDAEVAAEVAKIEQEDRTTSAETAKYIRQLSGQQPPAAPAVQPRPKKPCDQCKAHKKGCDRALPSCTRCQNRSQPCVYSRG